MIRTGNDRWKIMSIHQNCCSSDGKQPTTIEEKNSFYTKVCERISLHDKSGNPCELYTARGKKLPDQPAKIVSIFTTRWSIYDKFGQWSSLEPQLRLIGSETGPSASALIGSRPLLETKGNTVGLQEPSEELEAQLYFDKKNEDREKLVEENKAEAGDIAFEVTTSLRATWLAAQRMDPELSPLFKEMKEGYRKGPDGVIERLVKRPGPLGAVWLPVVPAGNATSVLNWKQWVFLQCHVGVLGAHRNAEKTLSLILRRAWWQGAEKDVERWCQK